ncbi:MAG: hypothetical protein UR80_C0001G0007 [Parcubacteria group bacterium GW2011_GWB1_35_5]|nr:MAG: hypothetical protein UR80_C0001G0007 [Parcubacteria group bacterium GW2011_GWB1_35_5]
MDIHDIHGTNFGIHEGAKESKDFLRGEDRHIVEGYLKHAEEHGKAHFEDAEGRKFTMEHKDGVYNIRPRHI